MSLRLKCSNGHKLNVRGDLLGKRVKCPKCGDVLVVEDQFESIAFEDLPAVVPNNPVLANTDRETDWFNEAELPVAKSIPTAIQPSVAAKPSASNPRFKSWILPLCVGLSVFSLGIVCIVIVVMMRPVNPVAVSVVPLTPLPESSPSIVPQPQPEPTPPLVQEPMPTPPLAQEPVPTSMQVGTNAISRELPHDYTDFAYNPNSDLVAALLTDENEVHFFRCSNLREGIMEPFAKTKVGERPSEIAYKEFEGKQYFAVVCEQEARMFIIEADPNSSASNQPLSVLHAIELNSDGQLFVTCSLNPRDPFLYYGAASKKLLDHVFVAAVSVRDFSDKGIVIGRIGRCKISADGSVFYRLEMNPSGFQTYEMTKSYDGEKPEFLGWTKSQFAKGVIGVVDPFGYVAGYGKSIFNRDLSKTMKQFDAVPVCISTTQPLVFTSKDIEETKLKSGEVKKKIQLKCYSYNTFKNTGEAVELEFNLAHSDRMLPLGKWNPARAAPLPRQTHFFSDEQHHILIRADGNSIVFVPFSQFGTTDEVHVSASIDGPRDIEVDKESTWKLSVSDSQVSVTLEDAPEGMQLHDSVITWKPTREQIGSASFLIKSTCRDIVRKKEIHVQVTYPSTKLPISVAGFSADTKGEYLFLWKPFDINHLHNIDLLYRGEDRFALFNLATGATQSAANSDVLIKEAVLMDDHVFALPQTEKDAWVNFVNILDRKTLANAGKLEVGESVLGVKRLAGFVAVQTPNKLVCYDPATLKVEKSFEKPEIWNRWERPNQLTSRGLLGKTALYDETLRAKAILAPGPFLAINGQLAGLDPKLFEPEPIFDPSNPAGMRDREDPNNEIASTKVPGTGKSLKLTRQTRSVDERIVSELTLFYRGGEERQQKLNVSFSTQDDHYLNLRWNRPRPVLQATSERVFAIYVDRLYQWDIPKEDPAIEPLPTQSPLKFAFKQSTLTLAGPSKTTLIHQLEGVRSKVTYSCPNLIDGMVVDQNTGSIQVENRVILRQAKSLILEDLRQRGSNGQSLQAAVEVERFAEHARQLLGRKLKGYPVAFPVQIEATDEEQVTARFSYWVIAEVPLSELK